MVDFQKWIHILTTGDLDGLTDGDAFDPAERHAQPIVSHGKFSKGLSTGNVDSKRREK